MSAREAGLPVARLLAAADDGDAFVLLEGARIPRLRERLQATGCEYWCLLCADLDGPLRNGAPYLLRLRRAGQDGRASTPLQLAPTGVLLLPVHPVCGSVLRTHLRRWMRAPMRSGGSGVFRFFDPQCLRDTLPLLPEAARRAFLAPLGRVFVASCAAGGALELTGHGQAAAPSAASAAVARTASTESTSPSRG